MTRILTDFLVFVLSAPIRPIRVIRVPKKMTKKLSDFFLSLTALTPIASKPFSPTMSLPPLWLIDTNKPRLQQNFLTHFSHPN